MCLVLLPIWLTWMEVTGVRMTAEDYQIEISAFFERETWPHFLTSIVLIVCGVVVRSLLALGLRLPWALVGMVLFSAFCRLVLGYPHSHDVLSHTLYDSCSGYNKPHDLIGISCLIAAIIIALGACHRERRRSPFPDEAEGGFAATP